MDITTSYRSVGDTQESQTSVVRAQAPTSQKELVLTRAQTRISGCRVKNPFAAGVKADSHRKH
jgi:hypothetical protein